MAVRKVKMEVPEELKGLTGAKHEMIYIGNNIYQMSELAYEDFELCGEEIAELLRSVFVKVMGTTSEEIVSVDEFASRMKNVLVETGILARITRIILRGVDDEDLKVATLSQLIDATTKFQKLTFSSLTEEARAGFQIIVGSFVSFFSTGSNGNNE